MSELVDEAVSKTAASRRVGSSPTGGTKKYQIQKVKKEKYCLKCKNKLTGKYRTKFCSRSCANSYNNPIRKSDFRRKKKTVICVDCGKNFSVNIHYSKIPRCKNCLQNRKIISICIKCHEKFEKEVRYRKRKICSSCSPSKKNFRKNSIVKLSRIRRTLIKNVEPFDVISEPTNFDYLEISPVRHALVKFLKMFCKKEKILWKDFLRVRRDIYEMIYTMNMSPSEIRDLFSIKYTDFGIFLKKAFHIKLRDTTEAVKLQLKKAGKLITEEKYIYYKKCEFNFPKEVYPLIPGWDLLLEKGIYHPVKNPDGVCRDHMLSIAEGFRRKIPPEIISHPANCRFITNYENIVKNDKSILTLEELEERISRWPNVDNDFIDKAKPIYYIEEEKNGG